MKNAPLSFEIRNELDLIYVQVVNIRSGCGTQKRPGIEKIIRRYFYFSGPTCSSS